MYNSLENRNWSLDLDRQAFYSNECKKNGYKFIKATNEEKMCSECHQLKYKTQLQKLLDERNKQHTNYKFYSSVQLVEKLGEKNDQINKSKLENLNLQRKAIFPKNKQTDHTRLLNLIGKLFFM